LSYADDLNLLEDNMNTINKNTEALTDASEEAGLEVSTENTTYMLMSCYWNVGQNLNTKMFSDAFQRMALEDAVSVQIKNIDLLITKLTV
jgi:hypothetical protein